MHEDRFMLVHLIKPKSGEKEAEKSLEELKSLVTTFGGATVVKIIQKRDEVDNDTYIGKGKAQEIAQIIKNEKINIIVINDKVKPSQIFNLQRLVTENREDVRVWDRIDLILNIFEKHANTKESKLQIELARMRHMGPRMYGLGRTELSRQGGGIGTRGIGETNIELMKRHWRDHIKQTQQKIKKLQLEREKQMQRRHEHAIITIAIVGYTNAGKTTLFNRLTKKNKQVENALFTTLDSAVGQVYLPTLNTTALVSDTIGFIKNVPPQLIEAFKSTLLESIHADILLHVIDCANDNYEEKINAVEKILTDLKIKHKKTIYVFNKIDKRKNPKITIQQIQEKYTNANTVFISAEKNLNINELVKKIENEIAKEKQEKKYVYRKNQKQYENQTPIVKTKHNKPALLIQYK